MDILKINLKILEASTHIQFSLAFRQSQQGSVAGLAQR